MDPDSQIELQLVHDDGAVPDERTIRSWVTRALEMAGGATDAAVTVRVVGEPEMRELNASFRDKDAPTNVLSFPAGSDLELPQSVELPLGDLVICAPVVSREAAEQGKLVVAHWAHMLVHGTLHLLGFDHMDEADALEMEALERKILAAGGVEDPYVAA